MASSGMNPVPTGGALLGMCSGCLPFAADVHVVLVAAPACFVHYGAPLWHDWDCCGCGCVLCWGVAGVEFPAVLRRISCFASVCCYFTSI